MFLGNLIQVILTTLADMMGFIIIIALIICGFSLIFLSFARHGESDEDEDNSYGRYLYDAYQVLYGPLGDEGFSFSQKLLMSFILFLLNVVLLNLLISIMGDSYDKVQEKRVLTDSLTRLELIREATAYMK